MPFFLAIEENMRHSSEEDGCIWFHVAERIDQCNSFVIYEAYTSLLAFQEHQATKHYQKWKRQEGKFVRAGGKSVEYITVPEQTSTISQKIEMKYQEPEASESAPYMVFDCRKLPSIDRGDGIRTVSIIGRESVKNCQISTGTTEFPASTSLPMHCHNVGESILVLFGEAVLCIDEMEYHIAAGDSTWVPAGKFHRIKNRGTGMMKIYWTYCGNLVFRTNMSTGRTIMQPY